MACPSLLQSFFIPPLEFVKTPALAEVCYFMIKMKQKLYKITWKATVYGESFITANSKEQAKELTNIGYDEGFVNFCDDANWEITKIQEVREDGSPYETEEVIPQEELKKRK